MARIEWAMWANEQGVASAVILLVGGIIAVSGKLFLWPIGAYAIVMSMLIFIIEYPRGKRSKGRTIQRSGQITFAKLVSCFGPLGRNYYVRFLFYLLACVPCVFLLSTVMGALCLLVTSLIYLKAAIANEKWIPCEVVVQNEGGKSIKRLRPPSMAPPRMKQTKSNEGMDHDHEGNSAENRV